MIHLYRSAAVLLLAVLAGCASYERTRGVENTWRDPALSPPVIGQTTQSDVIRMFGPPSQVIGLGDRTVFYYLAERGKGRGAILVVYNWLKEDVTYDRAIFFFDAAGLLQDYGLSHEAIAHTP